MNTSKQVNVMIGLMFVLLVGTLLYFLWDDVRAEDAEERQIVESAERGGRLFSLNCRACHGVGGLGTLENAKLPGLPLNLEANRPVDPDTNEPDLGELMNRQNRFRDTIRCGRVGTLMPQWAEDQGGPLNDFQIEQLVALITGAMPGLDVPEDINAVSELGWEAAVEEADHTDFLEGKKLARAVGPEDTVLVLTDARELTEGSLLRIDDEVVEIVGAPESEGGDEILVERGFFGTQAVEHEEDAQIFAGPIEPPTGPLIGEDGDAPCGQRGVAAPAPAASPTPTPVQAETPAAGETPTAGTSVDVSLVEFAVNPAQDTADAGTLTFSVSNDGATIHNLRVVRTDLAPDELLKDGVQVDEGQVDVVVSTADLFGGATEEKTVDLDAGSYVLICNVPGHYDLGMRTAFTVK